MLIVVIVILLLIPWAAQKIQKKVSWLSSIVFCYALGIVGGNLFQLDAFEAVIREITHLSVLISIPLLLFGSDVRSWIQNPGIVFPAFLFAVASTLFAVCAAYFLMGEKNETMAMLSAMLIGVYSGGTTNLNAVGMALEASSELFVLANTYDTVYSALYLFVLLTPLRFVFVWFLPKSNELDIPNLHVDATKEPSIQTLTIEVLKHLGYAVTCVLTALAVSMLVHQTLNATTIILVLSALAVAASLLKPIKKLKNSDKTANYFLELFAVSMGSMANVSALLKSDLSLFFFVGLVFLIMLGVYFLLMFLFRFPQNESIIASTAAVFGPPFIGPVAFALNRKDLILPGIASAILGNAVGTYLGLTVYYVLIYFGI